MYQLVAIVCFSNSDRVYMVMLYGVADGNARLALELWIESFPNRAIACAPTFTLPNSQS